MTDRDDDEELDAEGLPPIEGHPPGIDIETDQEGLVPPRDHPIAAGDDPAYPTTAREALVPEGVWERAERELPDFGADLGVGGGVQGSGLVSPPIVDEDEDDEDEDGDSDDEDDDDGLLGRSSIERDGIDPLDDLDELAAEDERDEIAEAVSAETARPEAVWLLDPEDYDESELGTYDDGELIALTGDEGGSPSAEEAAIHIEPEPGRDRAS